MLTIDDKHPRRFGPLAWLMGGRRCKAVLSLAVPRDCRVELHAVSASVMVGGLRAPVLAKTVSGEITLAGLAGRPTPRRSRERCRPPASPGT